ncbi:MAG TPA: 4-hydroxy-3-methylbut-2-enyl diphosphate reductase [Bacteroides sp.]|nr:4-hydroxy-3-methylbut-2-enyl diphosphate reductase [Bacteroides sp.]
MIRIEVDEKSGFCTGVVRAVKKAQENLEDSETLHSLGDLVHNPEEVNRLEEMGLQSISYDEFEKLRDTTVLIRAHGEPPATFRKAEAQNIKLVDATCPIVRRLQKQIGDTYSALRGKQGSILIFGKSSHPEVRALVGQTEGNAIVVRDPRELSITIKSPVYLYSQTTMNLDEYGQFQDALKDRMISLGMDPEKDLHVYNTVCGQVSSREKYLREFVARYDLIFFVSGRESSNGKALFKICKKVNDKTYFISNPQESDEIELNRIGSIGICGATSTPGWLMSAVKARLQERMNISGS